MQSLFQQGTSTTLRLLLFSTLSITLMTFDHRDDTLKDLRTHIASYLVYPLQFIVDIPTRIVSWSAENLASRDTLIEENQMLRNKNLHLQTRLLVLESLEKENERLRALLKSSRDVAQDSLVAELLTVDMDPYKQQIVLNKGKIHGVYNGQPIIDAKGIMGQIVQLNIYSSTALLISDPSHALPVQITRTGIRTLAQGTGNAKELKLMHIPTNADVEVGDLIVTSGLGGRFPANYPVAHIAKVELVPGNPFALVTATPTAMLDKSREVLLIWPPQTESAAR